MLKTKVFLSGVTNLSDARYAAGMGVDYIGFNISPENKRFVNPEQVKTISEWVSGVSIIGEVDNNPSVEIKDYPVDTILINNLELIDQNNHPILKVKLSNYSSGELSALLDFNSSKVSFFVLEVSENDLKKWQEILNEVCSNFSIYIETVYSDENLSIVVDDIRPKGIVLYGSEEEKPGLSSYDGIADILEQLELD